MHRCCEGVSPTVVNEFESRSGRSNAKLYCQVTFSLPSSLPKFPNRELRQRRRRRQRRRHKIIGLMSKNNRSACAFYILVHLFAVLCKTTTSNDKILGFLENVSTRR